MTRVLVAAAIEVDSIPATTTSCKAPYIPLLPRALLIIIIGVGGGG